MKCPKNVLEQKKMEDISYVFVVGSFYVHSNMYEGSNISFVVGILGRYQSNLYLDNWKVVNKVLKYIQGIKHHILTYRKYIESYHVDCMDTRKLTFGCVYF